MAHKQIANVARFYHCEWHDCWIDDCSIEAHNHDECPLDGPYVRVASVRQIIADAEEDLYEILCDNRDPRDAARSMVNFLCGADRLG